MAKTRLTVRGLKEARDAFRRLPDDAIEAFRDNAVELVETMASRIEVAASTEGRQAPIVADTIEVEGRRREPRITVGGFTPIGRHGVPAYKLLFGSEFGSNAFRQFGKPHSSDGYWFFPTFERERGEIDNAVDAMADDIVSAFTRDGGL